MNSSLALPAEPARAGISRYRSAAAVCSALAGFASALVGAPERPAPAFWTWAATPPMGWNSYDSFGDSVTESEVLADGSRAVGFFDRTQEPRSIVLHWPDAGMVGPPTMRELWQRADLGVFDGRIRVSVRPHGAVLLRFRPRSR